MVTYDALHRKLIRDLIHMRGQMFAVTLVLACGIATYVTMRSAFLSLEVAQSDYYSNISFCRRLHPCEARAGVRLARPFRRSPAWPRCKRAW